MTFDPDAAAAALAEARRARRPAGPLDPDIVPRNDVEGVATQLALARRLGALPPGGFKIGATAKRMQDYLGLDGPAVASSGPVVRMGRRGVAGGELAALLAVG